MKVCKCIGVMENYNFVKEGEVYKYKISVYLPDYCEYSIYSYDGKMILGADADFSIWVFDALNYNLKTHLLGKYFN